MTADRHLALSDSTGWNFPMASGAGAGSSQQALPLYPRVSHLPSQGSNASTSLSLSSVHLTLAH